MAIVLDQDGNEISVTLSERSTLKFLELETYEYVHYSDEVSDEAVQYICDTQKELLKQDIRKRNRKSTIGACLFFAWICGTVFFCYKGAEEYFQYQFNQKQLNDWKVGQQAAPAETVHFPGVRRIGSTSVKEIQRSIQSVETMTPEAELKKISMMFKVLADKYAPIRERNVIPYKVFQKINTRFVDGSHLKKEWAGYCEELKYQNVKIGIGIVIDINDWLMPGIDYWRREQLVFHEYGHCILDLEHDDEEIVLNGEKIPRSVMNSRMFQGTIYLRYREYYLTELFSHLREKAKEKHAPVTYNPEAETPGGGQYYYADDDD